MTGFVKPAFALSIAALCAGCVGTPQQYETAPVQVETSRGTVTCQLYTLDQILWDRSIDRPDAMTVREADDVCRAEGQRIIDERRRR